MSEMYDLSLMNQVNAAAPDSRQHALLIICYDWHQQSRLSSLAGHVKVCWPASPHQCLCSLATSIQTRREVTNVRKSFVLSLHGSKTLMARPRVQWAAAVLVAVATVVAFSYMFDGMDLEAEDGGQHRCALTTGVGNLHT